MASLYVSVQVAAAIASAWIAHAIIELSVWQISTTVRSGSGQWLAEGVATFGSLLTIFGCLARAPGAVPYVVDLYITSAYWFTTSTSFANLVVTIAQARPKPRPQ